MPKQKETVELNVNGQLFTAWEQITCSVEYGSFRQFSFLATEAIQQSGGRSLPNWSSLQIKPSDACTIKLAGQKFCTGTVNCRVAQYNESAHNVLISGASDTYQLIDASASWKDHGGGQFRGKTVKQIAEAICKPFGISVEQHGENKYSEEPIDDAQIRPGQTCFSFIGDVARQRAITLMDDEAATLILYASLEDSSSSGALVEGKNILTASCRIEDTTIFPTEINYAQARGTDAVNMRAAAQIASNIKRGGIGSQKQRYKPYIFLADRPHLQKDSLARTDYEGLWNEDNNIAAEITVYGWQRDGGQLWTVGNSVRLQAPMLMVTENLWIQHIEFSQTNEGGSLTKLRLVNRLGIDQITYGIPGTAGGRPSPAKAGSG